MASGMQGMVGLANKVAQLSGVGLLGLAAVKSMATIVPPGYTAVKFDQLTGMKKKLYSMGLNFRIPMLQTFILYDTRVQPRVLRTTSGTKDQQQVGVTLRILYHPLVDEIPWLHNMYGPDYAEKVLVNIGNEEMKAIVALHNAEELITKRDEVSRLIRGRMQKRALEESKISIRDVALMDTSFSSKFMEAVEAKQVMHQEAEKARWHVEENRQKKLAQVTLAEGHAESAEIITQAIKKEGTAYIEIKKIETQKSVAEKLSKNPNVSWLPEGVSVLLGAGAPGMQPQQQQRRN